MDAERKVIDGIFPVTTTKAVYIDGTNITLEEALNNGEIGGATAYDRTTGRGYVITMLRGCEINIYALPERISS